MHARLKGDVADSGGSAGHIGGMLVGAIVGRVALPHTVAAATVGAPPQLENAGAVCLAELARSLDGFREPGRDIVGNYDPHSSSNTQNLHLPYAFCFQSIQNALVHPSYMLTYHF